MHDRFKLPASPAEGGASRPRVLLSRRTFVVAAAMTALPLAFGCTPSTVGSDEHPESEFSNENDAPEPADVPETVETPEEEPHEPTLDERAAQKTASLTLEQKVAQLFVVTPEDITGVDTVTQAGSATESALTAYPVGGIVYFQKNLLDPKQTKTMIANAQSYADEASGLPLFVGVDEEGGTVTRIANNPGFDEADAGNMADVGASGDAGKAEDVAKAIGTYLRKLGFNLDFAPDSDICGDPATDVMALRSFGTDPELVADMVSAQVKGFAAADMLCCAKHFPGIGGLAQDSHEGAIVSNKTLDELRKHELVPFKAAIEAGVPMIMVGHLSVPKVSDDGLPASLNPAIVTDLLRDELGFEGLVITDSLAMGAVDGVCEPDQAAVAAVKAGVDLVLMPADFPGAYQGLLDAVKKGDVTEARIDESVTRIVKTKLARLGA